MRKLKSTMKKIIKKQMKKKKRNVNSSGGFNTQTDRLNSETTGQLLIGSYCKESPAGVPSDWTRVKASKILTHTLHLRHIKVQTSSDTNLSGAGAETETQTT